MKNEERKHCQCCGRAILANTGVMAHHGYTRPGWGYQTGSCMGARKLPFEVARDELGRMLAFMEKHLGELRDARASVQEERAPATIPHTEHKFGKTLPAPIEVTRATFDAVKAANVNAFLRHSAYDFDKVRDADLRRRDFTIKNLAADVVEQRARFDGWKQTERREGDRWVKV